jgi:rSAM/selenodomain-associated transferase 2
MLKDKITVVVPVLNEEKILCYTLGNLKLTPNEELIVSDGGSTDSSVSIAREFTEKVFVSTEGKGRGYAMNIGALHAKGKILFFLHADCILDIIRRTLRRDGVIAGAFDISIATSGLRYRIIEKGANIRSRITSIPYGDQGIFMKKEDFERIGGFADIALMEDIEISKRLKRLGKIVFIRPPIITSPRRWLKEGAFYTTIRDWTIALLYSLFRISPVVLKQYYKDIR